MHVMLLLTTGHLSNKDRTVWLKRCPYIRGVLLYYMLQPFIVIATMYLHDWLSGGGG